MKRYIVFPLIFASLSLTIEMRQDAAATQSIIEEVVHVPADDANQNELTIYKDPKFISKWNSQFVEVGSEETEE